MTPENIATLDQAMDDAGVRHTTERYEGAEHGYTMSDMGAYNEAATERHFAALFALLQRAIPRLASRARFAPPHALARLFYRHRRVVVACGGIR